MMRKPIISIIFLLFIALNVLGQTDTIVTRLKEIAVVGVKQTSANDMSAMSTINAKEIEQLDIVTMRGVSELVPNFYMPEYGSRMTSSIYVRGLGARIDQPVVGLNIDNVPYLNKDNYDFDLFDIDKIEVFRGAQSILNGRNTMAGQINITTLSPWRYQGWKIMAEYGSGNTIKAGIGYYNKFSPNVASSLTAYYTHSDGFFRNEYNNGRLDRENQGSMRWKLSWHPSSRLSFTNVASGQISRQGGYPYENLATGQLAYNDTCFYRRNSFADGLTVGWTGKRVIITSVTSFQYIDDNMTLDQDFLPDPYFIMSQKRKEYALTEDIYARGSRGSFTWLGGVFGFLKRMDMDAPVTFKDTGISSLIEKFPNMMNPTYPIRWDERQFVLGSNFIGNTKGIAIYEQSTYKWDKWKFELGLRFEVERATLDYHSHCNTAYTTYHKLSDGQYEVYSKNPVNIDERGNLHQTFVQLLPKFAIGYYFSSQIETFINVAKGYKAGGFNTQMFSDVLQQKLMGMMGITSKYDVDEIVSYKPEKSWNFELGVKSKLFDNKLDADLTLFYISCLDQQLTVFPDGLTTGRVMTNAGRTRSFGAEVSVVYRPTRSFVLQGSYGYTNARFVEYDNGKIDLSGKRLPYAPQNTAMIMADYGLPKIGSLSPSININVRGVGDIYWDDENNVCQPFYVTCGASIALAHKNWSLRVFGENLTDTHYNTFYFVSMQNAFVQRSRPTTFGATLRVNL